MAKPKRVNMWQNIEYDNEKSTLKDNSNLNNVFRVSTLNVKQSAQAKLWWLIQTPTSNISTIQLKEHRFTTREFKEDQTQKKDRE